MRTLYDFEKKAETLAPGELLSFHWTHFVYELPSLLNSSVRRMLSKGECVIFLGETRSDEFDVWVRCLTSVGVGWCVLEMLEDP